MKETQEAQEKDGAVSQPASSNSTLESDNESDTNVGEAIELPPLPKSARITPLRRRSLRAQRARKEAPKTTRKDELDLPDWFAQKCVKPWDSTTPTNPIPKDPMKDWSLNTEGPPEWHKERTLFNAEGSFWRMSKPIKESAYLALEHYLEIAVITAASFLTASSPGRNTFWGLKGNLALYSDFDGGSTWLNSIVDQVAKDQKADILRLDAQDLMEIGGAFVSPNAKDFVSVRTLGFDAFQLSRGDQEDEMEEDEGEEDINDGLWHAGPESSKEEKQKVKQAIKEMNESFGSAPKSTDRPAKKQTSLDDLDIPTYTAIDDRRATAFWNTIINSARAQVTAQEHLHSSEQKLMVCIEDFMEISDTSVGEEMLNSLVDIIERRRGHGEKIMIVGTTSSSELAGDEDAQKELDDESQGSLYRTVLITNDAVAKPPPKPWDSWNAFWNYEKGQRIAAINLRNIQWMLKQIQPDSHYQHMSADMDTSDFVKEPHSTEKYETHTLFDQVLKQEDAQRIALTVIGFRESGLWNAYPHDVEDGQPSLSALIKIAIRACQAADGKRSGNNHSVSDTQPSIAPTRLPSGPQPWDKEEKKSPKVKDEGNKAVGVKARLEALKSSCTHYEKQLLGGVVLPESISTTFKDIHVAPDTVTAVRTLTSLSLSRPDAFSYGVLATDSISGLLLYGPPGTGKTLLAKAVAVESGSTVLKVTGADTSQMYVGESEKIVKAIFTLARKLTPCVVFIDEADSILAARAKAGSTRGKYHGDTLNQLLLEWDGLSGAGVFLMVATNRPFDLDDAVLRRLPRRVLVDLPVKEDREAILGIHLRNEQLDPCVSLSALAEQTPFYSGSDLKNVAVSAALACIKEEFEAKQEAEKNGDMEFKYAEKRTLTEKHFKIALGEVSSSISADMSSLKEVKKFDEQFGAGKGKKKKSSFGFLEQEGKEVDARVRG